MHPLKQEDREKGITTTFRFTVDYDIGHQTTTLKPLLFSNIDLAGLTESKLLFEANFTAQAPQNDFDWKKLLLTIKTTIEGGNFLTFIIDLPHGTSLEVVPEFELKFTYYKK